MAKSKYTAADITVLEGLEPVRKRPGMYIGGVDSRGLHHLVWEIVDNAVDEVINGYADAHRAVTLPDGTEVEVSDNGRGIPVDVHPKYKKPALELILTTLHAGGKFEARELRPLGRPPRRRLVGRLRALVGDDRHGPARRRTSGSRRSRAASDLEVRSSAGVGEARGSGHDDPLPPRRRDLRKLAFDAAEIRERLEAKTYLHRGLRVVFVDETQRPSATSVSSTRRAPRLSSRSSSPSGASSRRRRRSSFYVEREEAERDASSSRVVPGPRRPTRRSARS